MSLPEIITKRCTKCGEKFETQQPRRRLCSACRLYVKPLEQKSNAQTARTLPKMTWDKFNRLVDLKGVREFHNGATRRRHVIGIDFFMVTYKSTPYSRTASGVIKDNFVKWCKGYVKNGVMFDADGNKWEGASEDVKV